MQQHLHAEQPVAEELHIERKLLSWRWHVLSLPIALPPKRRKANNQTLGLTRLCYFTVLITTHSVLDVPSSACFF